jgi:hypothetical protein
MVTRRRNWFATTALALVVLVAILMVEGGATSAQEASGSPTAAPAHPVHIHPGSCAILGDIAYPLNDLVPPQMGQSPMQDTPSMEGGEIETMSTSTIVLPEKPHSNFEQFVSGGHSINVHASAEDIGTYIACGDIVGGGSGHQLQLELQELNGSGYQGLATLTDNGDGTMTVAIVLTRSVAAGTPVASPAA